MWYVIQTITGREQELAIMIRNMMSKTMYECCFVIRAECMKRLEGTWQKQVRPLFPGYIFIETASPDEVFQELRQIPRFSRLLSTERYEFTAVEEEEKQFLLRLCGNSIQAAYGIGDAVHSERGMKYAHALVRLTMAETNADGSLRALHGPLEQFQGMIERINLHRRYAVVRVMIGQKERTVLFGLCLEKDRDVFNEKGNTQRKE